MIEIKNKTKLKTSSFDGYEIISINCGFSTYVIDNTILGSGQNILICLDDYTLTFQIVKNVYYVLLELMIFS